MNWVQRQERNQIIVQLLRDHPEVSYQTIGNQFGITREAVRLIGKAAGVLEGRSHIKAALRAQQWEAATQAARETMEAAQVTAEEAWELIEAMPRCRVCQGPLDLSIRRNGVTCSHRCARWWVQFRYILDDKQRERHRLADAKTPNTRKRNHPWAKKAGTSEDTGPNRRFITPEQLYAFLQTGLPLPPELEKSAQK